MHVLYSLGIVFGLALLIVGASVLIATAAAYGVLAFAYLLIKILVELVFLLIMGRWPNV